MKNAMPNVVIDSREQTPFQFADGVKTEPGTLATGDYSLVGLTELCTIERKSLDDLCGCVTTSRDRFKRELHRLQAFRCRAVIIQADMAAVMRGDYRSRVTPAAVLGSVSSWMVRYRVPFVFAGDHGAAVCESILRNFFHHLVETLAAGTRHGNQAHTIAGKKERANETATAN